MTDPVVQQVGNIRKDVADLKRERVTYRSAEVVAVNPVASTFTADVAGAGVLEGIGSPPQFLPAVGDLVQLSLSGATPIYQPGRIAADAVGTVELDPAVNDDIAAGVGAADAAAAALAAAAAANDAADEAALAATTAINTANEKNTRFNSLSAAPNPDPDAAARVTGDQWWQRNGTGGIVGMWRWDGDSWEPETLASQVIASLDAGKITSGTIAVGVNIDVGDPDGEYTRISSNGVVAYVDDPVDGVPNEIARLGRNSGGANPVTGEQTWNVDTDGNAYFNSITANELQVGGTDLAGILDQNGRGIQVWYPSGGLQSGIVNEYGVLEVYRNLARGRNYVITTNLCVASTENNGEIVIRVRRTVNGTRPTTASPLLAERFYTLPVGGRWNDVEFSFIFQRDDNDPQDMKFLVTVARGTGQATGSVSTQGNPPTIRVDDRGPYTLPAGTSANDGSTGGTSAPAPTRNDVTVWGVWAQNFRGNGTVRTDTTDLVQGLDPSGFNGDGRSLLGFGDLSGLLAGATIQSLHLYLYAYRWYDGVGEAIVGSHGYTTAPASFGSPNIARYRFPWSTAEGKFVDLTAWAAEFQSGVTKGITLGPSNSGDFNYYGRFLGVSDPNHVDLRPRLQIVYYK